MYRLGYDFKMGSDPLSFAQQEQTLFNDLRQGIALKTKKISLKEVHLESEI